MMATRSPRSHTLGGEPMREAGRPRGQFGKADRLVRPVGVGDTQRHPARHGVAIDALVPDIQMLAVAVEQLPKPRGREQTLGVGIRRVMRQIARCAEPSRLRPPCCSNRKLTAHQTARQRPGGHAVAIGDLPGLHRRRIATRLLQQPPSAGRQIDHHFRPLQCQVGEVDDIDVGLHPRRKHAAIVQPGEARRLAGLAAHQIVQRPSGRRRGRGPNS